MQPASLQSHDGIWHLGLRKEENGQNSRKSIGRFDRTASSRDTNDSLALPSGLSAAECGPGCLLAELQPQHRESLSGVSPF